ncbi:MAG: DUF2868 domain-containing protein [Enterobacterales bacterium]|nr:DUF2868 domain-containing protein [Enterobacterales bacterium]
MSDHTEADDSHSIDGSEHLSMKKASASFTQIIILIGFMLGIFVSWAVFSGDTLGRVNLIHLIFLYVFFPIFSLIVSTLSLTFGKGFNLSKIVGYCPFLSVSMKRAILQQSQREDANLQFFYQSQLAALSFSFASLLIFIILLISSDINFVWRSTLMDADFIYPLLQWIATPWKFWSSAQPDLSLLVATQEYRLMARQAIGINFGDWWRFILAGQIFYAIILRSVTALICRVVLSYRKRNREVFAPSFQNTNNEVATQYTLAKVVNQVNSNYSLTNWAGLTEHLVEVITSQLNHSAISKLKAGPLASVTEQLLAERWQQTQVILVKGWEPPLGELADYLENGKGYVLPVDWKQDHLIVLSDFHLDEWRRFIQPISNWQLLQLNSLKSA